MAYCGKVNKTLVELGQALGINAVGLSGLDGALLTGPRKEALRVIENGRRMVIRDDLSGRVEKVNVALLTLLLDHGYLPLVCPPALSTEGQAINVDGDRAAAGIAAAIGADRLIILSNVPGLLRDKDDEGTLIAELRCDRLGDVDALALGRMKKKVMGAVDALEGGVPEVIIADGRVDAPIDDALKHKGTWIH
jgi:acetylglutamate/LysW-gamma-L-alpha-aminoadipate kinase